VVEMREVTAVGGGGSGIVVGGKPGIVVDAVGSAVLVVDRGGKGATFAAGGGHAMYAVNEGGKIVCAEVEGSGSGGREGGYGSEAEGDGGNVHEWVPPEVHPRNIRCIIGCHSQYSHRLQVGNIFTMTLKCVFKHCLTVQPLLSIPARDISIECGLS